MVSGITIPEACAATCMASINVQRMSVHAAVTGDIDLLKLAVLHDPLVGAVSTPEEVWQMVDEMVVAQARGCRNTRMPFRPPRSGWRSPRSRPATGQGGPSQRSLDR
jgi:alpha-galactosidase/6-phospho-beta-glucosidase family protein